MKQPVVKGYLERGQKIEVFSPSAKNLGLIHAQISCRLVFYSHNKLFLERLLLSPQGEDTSDHKDSVRVMYSNMRLRGERERNGRECKFHYSLFSRLSIGRSGDLAQHFSQALTTRKTIMITMYRIKAITIQNAAFQNFGSHSRSA